jgi:putative phosphoribosyl transferase
MKIGYIGSSTAAAAALIAAAQKPAEIAPAEIAAVVSRGGRPDLVGEHLSRVQCPVLLIVGSLDEPVIGMNEQALAQMKPESEKKLVLVPGATHAFEEPGTLEQAARLARQWFQRHLTYGTEVA